MKITDLSKYGISQSVIDRLLSFGFVELTEVQNLAIESGLFDGKNLVVSAPTNTGKTFVGEMAAVVTSSKNTGNMCFMLVPLKALAEEKFEDFVSKYGDWGLKIAISTKDRTEFDEQLDQYNLIIATYEKLNAVLVRNPELIRRLGLIIVDELQTIGDTERGPALEVLLTKIITGNPSTQIIGLSATAPNAADVAKWLDAKLVSTARRYVDLHEGIINSGESLLKIQGYEIAPGDFVYRDFNTRKTNLEKKLGLNLVSNVIEKSKEEQMIIFERSQPKSEEIAKIIAEECEVTNSTMDIIQELDELVESTPLSRDLKKVLQKGIAFHHGGLLPEERLIIEKGFKDGKIRIVCSTTTLAAGVNTPAKNVIFRSYKYYWKENIAVKDYKNMAGRAGRLKIKDNFGRSVLFANTQKELEDLWNLYVSSDAEPISSRIKELSKIETSILGLIAGDTCKTVSSVLSFIEKTFFGYTYFQSSSPEFRKQFEESIQKKIDVLKTDGFMNVENNSISITELGKRCAQELLLPKTVFTCYQVLKNNRERIFKSDWKDLIEPIIQLVVCSEDGKQALLWPPRSDVEKEEIFATFEKNRENYLYIPTDQTNLPEQLRTTRMLLRWIAGVSYNDLRQYGNPGLIRRIAETVSWIMRGVASLIEKPLFDVSEKEQKPYFVLSEMLLHGVPENALEIIKLKIPGVGRIKAVHLAEAGFSTIESLIEATTDKLENVRGVGRDLTLRIKKTVESHIVEDHQRLEQSHIRKAAELKRDSTLLKRLYNSLGDGFVKTFIDIMREMGINATYVGDADQNGPDALIVVDEGKIVVEGKRKSSGKVRAIEAEEIRGKGASFNPISYVTIGYPDFVEEAKSTSIHTKTTLLRADIIGAALLAYWEGSFTKSDMVNFLKSGGYVDSLKRKSRPKSLLD